MRNFFIVLIADIIRLLLFTFPFIVAELVYERLYEKPRIRHRDWIEGLDDSKPKDELRMEWLRDKYFYQNCCLPALIVFVVCFAIVFFITNNSFRIVRALQDGKSFLF